MTPPDPRGARQTGLAWSLVALAAAAWLATVHAANAQQPPVEQSEPRAAFQLAPRGYIQFDSRGYPDWPVSPGTGRLEHDTFEVRRLRAGVDGRWRRLAFEVTLDPQDYDGTLVKDAYGQWRITRALRVRAGQFKLPGSRDYRTAARNLDFMERSALASSLAAGRDVGGVVTGELGRAFEYESGLFAGDGSGRRARAGLTFASRVAWRPASDLEIGGSFSTGRTEPVDDAPANGLEGRTASGYRFFDPVYVSGRRLRFGADARWDSGPWRVTAEALRGRDGREGQGLELETLPAVAGVGWSIAVRREFGRRRGDDRARLREWDLALRVDGLALDDIGAAADVDSVRPRATDVRRKAAQTLTGSVSWGPLRWATVIADVTVDRYDEARSAPDPGRRGPYWTAGTRLQLEWPW